MAKVQIFNNHRPKRYALDHVPPKQHAGFQTPSYAFKSRDEIDITVTALQIYLKLCESGTFLDVGDYADRSSAAQNVMKRLKSL